MKTGIVMECRDNVAVVLEAGGRFREVPRRNGWKPGDVVALRTDIRAFRTLFTAAACLALAFSGMFLSCRSYYAEAATISIDINPSIELGLNRYEKVVRLRAWNQEGEQLLERSRLKNKSLEEAVETLFLNGAADYVGGESFITYTVRAQGQEQEESMIVRLESATDQALSSCHKDAQVELYGVDGQLVEQAHAHHVSAGKYMALSQLQDVLPDADLDSYSHCSIAQIREKIVSSGGEIKEGNCEHHSSCSHECHN